ncbi:MAG: ribonuclease J [Alphaproteobacteria bacterium]|nr:ribonuclease J [Alphaproteobacteria bacterium]MBT5828318.1 ribonuclease J [Alphaproteobacteria bacterium]
MTINFSKYKDKFIFVPLGGAKEIGMNLNLYHYQGKWIIIDMGIGFYNEIAGIDVVVPDISFLQEIKKDILAIIITHAHEDHLGAVQYLWEEVKLPIYTSKFTGAFLIEKLKEYKLDKVVPIKIEEARKPFKIGPFDIELFEINHSVPEMNAAIISTPEGNVFHTGDWKFDNNPVIGKADDYSEIAKVGKMGISAMVCDSTNVFSEGSCGSEGDLQKSVIDIVKQQNNLVVVATFASNLSRVITIIKAAQVAKRKIVICGRALERIIKIGADLGYIKDMSDFIDRSQIKSHPRNKLLIMATGCQGEDRAAIRRIAHDIYPNVRLQKNDTVIFSSKIIPGNELKIGKVLNQLAKKQIHILTEKDHFVHVSGHPYRDDLKKMYELVKPQTAIPVHGEIMHINEHANFAENMGVKNILRVTNGSVVILDKKSPQIIGEVKTGYLGVDGNSLLDINSSVFKQRNHIASNGIVIVNIQISKSGKLLEKPIIRGPGLFHNDLDVDIIHYLTDRLANNLTKNLPAYIRKDKKGKNIIIKENAIIADVVTDLKKLLAQSINKKPAIEVFVSSF